MAAHDLRGTVRVTGPDRLQQLTVLGDVRGDPAGVGLHDGDAHPQLTVAQLVVEAGQDLVAGVPDDLGVETAVLHGDGRQITRLRHLPLLIEELLQPGDQLRGGGHGPAHGELLDQQPGLHDVRDLLRGDGEHQGALLRVELDQPLHLQPQQRLAHGRAGDPDGVREIALGEERPALVTAVQDRFLDVGVDALGGGGRFTGGRTGEEAGAGMRTA